MFLGECWQMDKKATNKREMVPAERHTFLDLKCHQAVFINLSMENTSHHKMIIFNSAQPFVDVGAVIAGYHFHFSSSLLHANWKKIYALDFEWNILTIIGIARKFNQKFYSSSSWASKSFANTIHYEWWLLSHSCCCCCYWCGQHHSLFTIQITIAHAHQFANYYYYYTGPFEFSSISKCNQHTIHILCGLYNGIQYNFIESNTFVVQ